MNRIRFAASVSSLLATFALAGTAAAADPSTGFAVNRFDPSERGSDWFSTESLDLRGEHRIALGAVTDYNHDPLAVRDTEGTQQASIVSDQFVVHVGGNITLVDRLRLGVDLPIAAYAAGTHQLVNGQDFNKPDTTAIGDVRLAADVRVYGDYGHPFTAAVGVQGYLPTGSENAYTGDGTFRFTPRVLAAGQIGIFEYAARLGYAFRQVDDRIQKEAIGSEITFGGSGGVKILDGRLLLGPEIFGGVGTADIGKHTNGIEILGGAHGKITDSFRASLGIGGGLSQGFGTPSFRTMASLEWAPAFAPKDAPPPPHKDDAPAPPPPAPVVVAPAPPPPVVVAEVAPPPAPADKDHDGIPDSEDACPDDAGPANADKSKNGCPAAILRNSRIEIMDQVKFRTGSAELDPASDPILDAVLKVMIAHPEIGLLRVDGHTDNKGAKETNYKLSAARAKAVSAWLSSHGLEAGRVKSRGYGQSQPIVPNDTDEGRRANRRVEFHVEESKQASR